MKKSKNKLEVSMAMWDDKRKSYSFLISEISDLINFLEMGYKDGDGKIYSIKILTEEKESLWDKMQLCTAFVIKYRMKLEALNKK